MSDQATSRNDLFRQRVAEFVEPLRQAQAGRVRAVHRVRVASRRLREMLPVMEADADECRRILKRLRHVTRLLGRLRELDVSAQLLNELRDSTRGESVGVRWLRKRVAKTRREAFEKVESQGFGRKLRRTAKQLTHLADRLSDGAPVRSRRWRWTLGARVANRAQSLLVAMDETGADFAPERVHRVRIELKKLRYAVELAEGASGTQASADLRRLTSAQSRLGRLHDRQILVAWVADVRTSLGARNLPVRRDLGQVSADLEAECRVLYSAYLRSRAGLRDTCRRILARTEGQSTTGSPARRLPTRLRQVRLA